MLAVDDQLLVLNRRSGSLSQVDLPARRMVGEWSLGELLADAERIMIADRPWLVACDERANELILAAWDPPLRVTQRLAVPATPTHLVALPQSGELIASTQGCSGAGVIPGP